MRPRWAQNGRMENIFSRWYPFGVAAAYARQSPKKPVALSHQVLFIAACPDKSSTATEPFSGEQGQLLSKAITQGLRWDIKRAQLLYACDDVQLTTSALSREKTNQLQKKLTDEIEQRQSILIVALGSFVEKLLDLPEKTNSQSAWIERSGRSFFASADLRDVIADAKIKRAFWEDLKSIANRFDQTVN